MSRLSTRLQKLEAKVPQPWRNPLIETGDLALSLLSDTDRAVIQRDLAAGRKDVELSDPELWMRWEGACYRASRELGHGFQLEAADLWL